MSKVPSPKGLRISDEVHKALRIRAAETGETMGEIAERALRKELGLVAATRTLQDLTGRESGIIIYDGRAARVMNWSGYEGIPRLAPVGPVDSAEEIPQVDGERCELADLLNGVEFDRGPLPDGEELPKTGTAYRISDQVVVVTPDGWV